MATSTILRVKRRLEENPQDALVLLCKRIKTGAEEIAPSLFVFRGTVDNEETSHVKSIVPKPVDIKLKSTHNVNDIIDKIRKERKEASAESRYEVVKCLRGLTEGDTDQFDLVDLAKKDQAADEQYAYDLYTAAKHDFDISMLDNLVGIENYETDILVFGSHRDNGRQTPSSDEANDDADDSNDENNWRNDYPDEESSINEDDIVRAVENVGIDSDLSSDVGEDKIYDGPPELSNEDVLRYGAAYAKYKARVIGTPGKEEFVHSIVQEIDKESLQGYKDDSDDGFYYGQEEGGPHFDDQYSSSDEPD